MAGGSVLPRGLLLSLLVPSQCATSMSWRSRQLRPSGPRAELLGREPHCAALTNHGTHSTVVVSAGTPEQRFDLVADTGSNAVIILSCACVDAGHCSAQDECFHGTNSSSTFSIGELPGQANGTVPSMRMSFGSGDIDAAICTDEVSVGGVRANMENGLLLMVDKALNIDGPFEGILGLGIPAAARRSAAAPPEGLPEGLPEGQGFEPPEFLPEAGVSRFSICFNDGPSGALRLGTPKPLRRLGSVGEMHWGLGFSGISVGAEKARVELCSPHDMLPGQSTPCGAIPDSGTTAIMAPERSLETLFEGICDAWERCGEKAAKARMPKAQAFVEVLADCGSWLEDGDSEGLSELPPLHFHVTGSEDGQQQDLELGGWSYVFETEEEQYALASQHLRALAPPWAKKGRKQGGSRRVCAPAFGVMDMQTQANGDVWILGTSFFYAYGVHYDLSTSPPSMAFQEEACGTCGDEATLVSQGSRSEASAAARAPRHVQGNWRVPRIDTSGPM